MDEDSSSLRRSCLSNAVRAAHTPLYLRVACVSRRQPRRSRLSAAGHAAHISRPPAAPLAVGRAARVSLPSAASPCRRPRRLGLPAAGRAARCSRLTVAGHAARVQSPSNMPQKMIRERATSSGYQYSPFLAGWPQPYFSGIFRSIWLPLSTAAPKPNSR
jgi:hypothetical protein